MKEYKCTAERCCDEFKPCDEPCKIWENPSYFDGETCAAYLDQFPQCDTDDPFSSCADELRTLAQNEPLCRQCIECYACHFSMDPSYCEDIHYINDDCSDGRPCTEGSHCVGLAYAQDSHRKLFGQMRKTHPYDHYCKSDLM